MSDTTPCTPADFWADDIAASHLRAPHADRDRSTPPSDVPEIMPLARPRDANTYVPIDAATTDKASRGGLGGGGATRTVTALGPSRAASARGDGAASMLLGGVEGDDAADSNVSAARSPRGGNSRATPTQIDTLVLRDFDELDEMLCAMNEAGSSPDLPFIDADGIANIAHGMAPSGDDWAVGFEAPREPDTGTEHCCQCLEHGPIECDAGAMWRPTFPIVALVASGGAPDGNPLHEAPDTRDAGQDVPGSGAAPSATGGSSRSDAGTTVPSEAVSKDIWGEVATERARAHAKHGEKSMESAPWHDPSGKRFRILLEEVGEVAKELNDADVDARWPDGPHLRQELIQVAAMAGAWADHCPVEAGA